MTEPNDAILAQVPKQVQTRIAWAFLDLIGWNGRVETCRLMEKKAGQPGRFEYDLRYGRDGESARAKRDLALQFLRDFAALARSKGLDPEAILKAMKGPPALEA